MTELKRAAEMSLVTYLATALPTMHFYPSRGGTDNDDATAIEPPFGVVLIDVSEHPLGSDVWMMHGHVVWVTSSERQTVQEASTEFRQIHEALKVFPGGLDAVHELMIHGLDIESTDEFSDGERQARGDTIEFAMGVTQRG